MHAQMATVQIIGYVCGSQAVYEINEIKVTDFVEHGPNWIEFKPSGVTKNNQGECKVRRDPNHKFIHCRSKKL